MISITILIRYSSHYRTEKNMMNTNPDLNKPEQEESITAA